MSMDSDLTLTSTRLEDLGRLILRLSVGGLLLLHGLAKFRSGNGFVEEMVSRNGLPSFVAYGSYVGEIVAPALVIVGLFVRPAGLIIAVDLLGAIFLARSGDVGTVTQSGAWAIETEMLFLLGGLAIACLGAGRFAFGMSSRWN
jgi:putative oxidoreductase